MLCALTSADTANARRIAVQTVAQLQQRAPGPLLVLVSMRKQRIRVFDNNGPITESRISSGQPGFDTPTGVFSILEKHVTHASNIYEGAQMPFMQRITWSGIALHAGIVPGYRASHGCVRLPYNFSKSLFDITKVGNRVVISQEEVEPIAFAHPGLFKPLPADSPGGAAALVVEDRKLAVNDADAAKSDEVRRLLASTEPPAATDTAGTPERPRSRAEAERVSNARLLELQSAMRTADARKTASGLKARAAMRAAEDAENQLKGERLIVENFKRAAEAAEKNLAQARSGYEDYMKAVASSTGSKVSSQADDREAELEDRILDLTIEADTARSEYQRRNSELPDVKAITAEAEAVRNAALDDVKTAIAQLRSIEAETINAQRDITRQARTLSVLISLKSQRIYVRQGFEPVIEAPISVDGGGAIKVGTHVFTAMDYAPGGNDFTWKLVSAQTPNLPNTDDDAGRKGKKRDDNATPNNANTRAARAALDAIKIPDEIRQTIAERIRPGASLIVSDREQSGETGDGTEFVVLTR